MGASHYNMDPDNDMPDKITDEVNRAVYDAVTAIIGLRPFVVIIPEPAGGFSCTVGNINNKGVKLLAKEFFITSLGEPDECVVNPKPKK